MTLIQSTLVRALIGATVAFAGMTLLGVAFLFSDTDTPTRAAPQVLTAFGVQTGVLDLDGLGGVRIDGPVDVGDDLTVECWARATEPQEIQTIFGTDNGKGFRLWTSSPPTGFIEPRAWAYVEAEPDPEDKWAGFAGVETRIPTPPGAWHHYALVHSDGELRLYVDGRLAASNDHGSRRTATTVVGVGGSTYAGTVSPSFRGMIDDVRISKTARYFARFQPPAEHLLDADTVVLLSFDDQERPWRNAVPQGPGARSTGQANWTRILRTYEPR